MIEAAFLESLRDFVLGVSTMLVIIAALLYWEARYKRGLSVEEEPQENEPVKAFSFPPRPADLEAETHFHDREVA